jgi:arylformamidase
MAPDLPIFLGYDRAGLDREYDNRKKVAGAAAWLARFAETSAATRAELLSRLDVAFGAHPGERLDIFLAERATPAPIHVFIHGGYWQWLDKKDFSFVARAFVPAGVTTVVINYALMPTVSMAELVRQCRASIAWVHHHAGSFGGDASRITISGHSAGGHLVAMLLSTDWTALGLPADAVKAGGGISGLYDLEPIRLCYLNDVLGLTQEDTHAHSPIHLSPKHPMPLLLPLGGVEGPEYHRQSEAMAAAWRRYGGRCDVLDLPGHDHFSIVWELNDRDSRLARALRAQI